MQRNETRASGTEFDGPSQTRDTNYSPEQAERFHSTPSLDRAMLRLCGVLRRIAEQNPEEMERAA